MPMALATRPKMPRTMKGLKESPAYSGYSQVLSAQSRCSLWTPYSPALAAGSALETPIGFSIPRNSRLGECPFIQGSGALSHVLLRLTQCLSERSGRPGGEIVGLERLQASPWPSPSTNMAKEHCFADISDVRLSLKSLLPSTAKFDGVAHISVRAGQSTTTSAPVSASAYEEDTCRIG